jgi:hypothetical protein
MGPGSKIATELVAVRLPLSGRNVLNVSSTTTGRLEVKETTSGSAKK